jgi:peptidoglycan hydrolase-like protein with peptidoglycan-binding domain
MELGVAGSFPPRLILIAANALLLVDSVEHPYVSVPSLLEHAATRPAGLFEDRILKTTTLTCAVTLALYSATSSFVFAAVAPEAPSAVALPLTAEYANDASLRGDVGPKQRNVAVLRVQILLDRARFFPGEVDASFGSNTRVAISGFQKHNGLTASGAMDEPTWAALNSDPEPVLVTYTVTEADIAGPFVQIPADMMDKAKLPALGYRDPVEALGEKFHASPALLAELNPGKDLGRAGRRIGAGRLQPAMTTTASKPRRVTPALRRPTAPSLRQYKGKLPLSKELIPPGLIKATERARTIAHLTQPCGNSLFDKRSLAPWRMELGAAGSFPPLPILIAATEVSGRRF